MNGYKLLPFPIAEEIALIEPNERHARLPPVFSENSIKSAIVIGDASRVLREFPSHAFQTCVTSPPYWSLRNYNIAGQIGLEACVDLYIAALVDTFEQVRRVLKDDGTFWLNIGDSFTSGGRTWRTTRIKKTPAVR